ncbi:MAG TPA: DotH/IcmK family type IV secretion protein [Gammaproteobacteria bacterium]|jgi:intracellular multiplication protein IcmK|nr:DotH/IcmK family type IV secretion protein [Gammaproteobacteria bacterium]
MLKVVMLLLLLIFGHSLNAFGANQSVSPKQFQEWLQHQKEMDAATPAQSQAPAQVLTGNGLSSPAAPAVTSTVSTTTTSTTIPATTTPSVDRMMMRQSATSGAQQAAPCPPPRVSKIRRPLTFKESQEAMLRSVPSSGRQPDPDATMAFKMLLSQNMPLTPEQVVMLRQQIDVSQRAAAIPPVIPPKPVSTTLMVNLAPGSTPPAIRLAQGYVSSLVFVDSTGEPWPVASFDIGNPKSVNMQWDGKSNVLLMQSVTPYTSGDMVIRLVGLPTPITLELVSGQPLVDYRVDLHVPGIGPNTKEIPSGSDLPESANQLLLGVLDGVPPPGSRSLVVRGADAQAWLLGDRVYFRTRMTLLSPGWVSKMVSPDGMLAYEIPKTSSVLVSRYGEPTELKIEGL